MVTLSCKNRELNGRGCLNVPAPESLQPIEKFMGSTVNGHPKTVSDECPGVGSSRTTGFLLDFEGINSIRPCETSSSQSVEKSSPQLSALRTILVASDAEKMQDKSIGRTLSSSLQNNSTGSFLSYVSGPLIKVGHNTTSNGATNESDTGTPVDPAEPSADSRTMQGFPGYFQNGYCKASEHDDCHETAEAVTDADSGSSHCEREKPEDDADGDDLLGGVFSFSEEG